MKHKLVLITPLVLAVALTMLITPAAAFVHDEFCGIGGFGFARVGPAWQEKFGRYICGEAFFGYCFTWDHALLIFGELDIPKEEMIAGVWEIVDERRGKCFETFRGEWVPNTGTPPMLYWENDLLEADIRVVTFLRDGERAFVIVYGCGVFFVGCRPVCMPWLE